MALNCDVALFTFVWLLCCGLANAQLACRPQEYHLASDRQVLNITSPNYPAAYPTGGNCRYRIVAPYDYVVVLNCFFEVFPNNCGTEYFYISRDGDLDFREGETFCSNNNVVRSSYFRSISMGYYSAQPTTNQRGRYRCEAYAQRQACSCGWTTTTRITNGQQTQKHEYPSMVALRDVTSSQPLFCGGSIISRRYILTAAHCMRVQSNPRVIVALLGEQDLSSATESLFAVQHRIQQVITHPNYAPSGAGVLNDLALLLTATPIEWTRGVGPVCLPLQQVSEAFTYRNVDVIGWGTISFAGPKSNTLQRAQLLTINNRDCATQLNTSIAQSQLCTYDYRGLGQDSCQYDSGGPVLLRQAAQPQQPPRLFLLGVISYGRACGARYSSGVNTRITTHLSWLLNYVGGAVCSYA